MKMILLILSTLLASCDRLNTVGASDTITLLKNGDASACSAKDVQQTLKSMIQPTDKDVINIYLGMGFSVGNLSSEQTKLLHQAESEVNYAFDLTTLAKVDKQIASVSCDANIVMTNPDKKQTYSIVYEIRPNAQIPGDIVISLKPNDARESASRMVQSAFSQLVAKAEASKAPKVEVSASPDVTNLGVVENSTQPPTDNVRNMAADSNMANSM